ncbi:MAG: ABC-ATPase domain-containing protein [Actinomycetota bacterium]|nr:ABC-ATPase domain-containing protein [Rubrobacteraceae bacterium]MBA3635508.1 ABC-ATPase domain-containing protein [Rubrobacteraceae bacterium]MDQ3183432.1 ABC-ATPase domain-containing protein [Actinomycetota bacterium]MDQ3496095.1 ABC-ATPase domain-containing protein [Actinomycetota bacterium]
MKRLRSTLDRIDSKGYGAYKDLSGSHDFGSFTLFVDRVQRDPFAPPSLIRVRTRENAFDRDLFANQVRRVAFEDFLTRSVEREIRRVVRGNRGSGGSGRVEIQRASQVVLPRTSMVVESGYVEARMAVGLPARGRSVDARAARTVLLEELPEVVRKGLVPAPEGSVDAESSRLHVETVEDADHLRGLLPGLDLVAFVADGAVLPRESGASDRLLEEGAVPFQSPQEYRVEVELPNRGVVSGMGVPEGVTLVAGGGFHGKSTLLSALSWGVYDHVPGDGRELVVARGDAVKVRAEDGRSVSGVDISAMIGDLPGGRTTEDFSTPNASGSTSQAANIAEALEVGTSLLLVDEDTSATNFMIRDERMRELVRREPISPFIDLVRPLHRSLGVSTVVVVGGVGDYLDVADRVILLEDYAPSDATARSREVTRRFPPRAALTDRDVRLPQERTIRASSVDLRRGKRQSARGRGLHTIELGRERVDLSYLEQLAEAGQTEAVARVIGEWAATGEVRGVGELVREALASASEKGLDSLGGFRGHPGEMSLPRAQDLAAAINRIRPLRSGPRM